MSDFESFAGAYRHGLSEILEGGHSVPSVLDPLSKASNFGTKDRPYREHLGHSFTVRRARSSLALCDAFPVNVAYCLGMLAWSLDGRNDVETLGYYRGGAHEFSDDEHTLSGAFGHRLFATSEGNQIRAIVERIRKDPGHRRTFAPIIGAEDNFRASREYPCAAGVQIFQRDGRLVWITTMRAQQALTVLPYDAFLFMGLQQFTAAMLGIPAGQYVHQSGTFHIYDDEVGVARRVVDESVTAVELPELPAGPDEADEAAEDLIALEAGLRATSAAGDLDGLRYLVSTPRRAPFVDAARSVLGTFALRRLDPDAEPVTSDAVPATLAARLV